MGIYAIILPILFLIIRLIIRNQNRQAINEIKETVVALRPSQDPSDYLILATNAMINRGQHPDYIKKSLMVKKLSEEAATAVIDKARGIYEKWESGLSPEERLSHDERVKNFDAAVSELPEEVTINPTIYRFSKMAHTVLNYRGSLMGHVNLRQRQTAKEKLYLVAALASAAPVKSNKIAEVGEASFKETGGDDLAPFVRTVTVKDTTTGILPYLPTEILTAFETKKIGEWKPANDVGYITEAEILGTVKGDFEVGFMATDYAINQHIYKTQPNLKMRLSAFIFSVAEWSVDNDLLDRAGNSIGFLLDKEEGRLSNYYFVGKIMQLKPVRIYNENYGQLIQLEIDMTENNSFVINVFVNNENMKLNQMTIGMMIRGGLWMQGEIAGNL
ncbi:MAG: hypothetical protein JWR09_688 [Mucilaginibacter sp.]|nr:hypothetical protein [Mucilaginibacter sp.]